MIHENRETDSVPVLERHVREFERHIRPLNDERSKQREAICRLYENARRLFEQGGTEQEINEVFHRMGELEGLQLISEPDFLRENGVRCAEWTFGFAKGEPWAQGNIAKEYPEFWRDTPGFLWERGYRPVADLKPGHVVAYGDFTPWGELWLEHFGVVIGTEGREPYIESKFGRGSVFGHPRDAVSTVWGGYYVYLDKKESDDLALL